MTLPASNWSRIPAELKQRKQWAIAGANKAPLVVGQNGLHGVSVTDPDSWMDFESAAQAAWDRRDVITEHENKGIKTQKVGFDIGYILHKDDPFTCIDIDVRDQTNEPNPEKWTVPQAFDGFWSLIRKVDSYTESSRSGKGFHIWIQGNIGAGVRRDAIEVYSQERFIICTGKVVLERGIEDRPVQLEALLSEMRGYAESELVDLEETESDISDSDLIARAMYASNGEKFNDLCAGDWRKYGFPSQSEADLALMSMFTFYSASNEQCRRLFRMSALGKREKAAKDDRYLNNTLRIIRTRQAREANVEQDSLKHVQNLIAQLNTEYEQRSVTPMHVPRAAEPREFPAPAPAAAVVAGPVTLPQVVDNGIDWPPGMAGAIASFVYHSAPRPVKEVAIVASLGLLAGLCGKAFAISQSGLNVYLILVARSAVGKEALHSGISALCKSVYERAPSIMDFVDFSDFASGPALVKKMVTQQSLVNVSGEWGRKLKRMAQDDGRDGPLSTLRTVMTNLYQKSGPQAIVGGITYSSKDNDISSVSGVAYSLIGESTPSTFFESLTESMMEDGFLSRFTIIEYDGDRPAANPNPITTPSQALSDAVAGLTQHAQHLIGIEQSVTVTQDNETALLFKAFELECDREINSTTDESWRQMWNRAALKAMRIAALLAVADNWMHPVVKKHHAEWAIDLIRRDIGLMQRRLESGDIGNDDNSRERKLLSLCRDYLTTTIPHGYGIPKGMQEQGIVPRKYLLTRTHRMAPFTSDRRGATVALDLAVRSLIDSGYICEIDKVKLVEDYSFHGKCYRIMNLPRFDLERQLEQ